jgi:hypothetical protein
MAKDSDRNNVQHASFCGRRAYPFQIVEKLAVRETHEICDMLDARLLRQGCFRLSALQGSK